MSPLAQLAYVKGIRASAPKGEDMGEACMDTACRGVVLVSKTQDVASKRGMVCVHAVDVDALQCHARRGHPPWDGQDAAMHHKLQAFAEPSENKRDVGVLGGYTWQDRVWRDRVKKYQ